MKIFRNKLSVFLGMLFIMVSMIIPTNTFATEVKKENGVITIENIKYGYGDRYKVSSNCPVSVKIKNNGEDFTGNVKILVPNKSRGFMGGQYDGYIAYEKSVNIEAGSEENVVIYTKLNSYSKNIVRIYKDSNVISEKTFNTVGGDYIQTPYIGVLSDDKVNMSYVKNINMNSESQNVVVNFSEKDFPKTYTGLDALNLIIISNFDTSKLGQNQYDALKQWVQKGGKLLIGTGENYKKTLNIFKDEFIKGNVTGTKVIKTNDGTDLNVANLGLNGSEVVVKENNENLVFRLNKQGGTVLITTFDLSSSQFVNSSKVDEFASEIVKFYPNNEKNNDDGYMWNINSIVTSFSETSKVSVKMLFSIFLIYLIFIFPSSYFVLKKKNKKEKMWYVIPVLAVAFSIVISGYIKISGVNDKNVTALNIVDIKNGKENIESHMAINNLTDNNVKITSNYDLEKSYDDYNMNNHPNDKQSVPDKITTTINVDDNSLVLNSTKLTDTIMLNGSITRDIGADISLELSLQDKSVVGKLTNSTEYKIEDGFIITKGGAVIKLDTIEPKSSRNLNFSTENVVGDMSNGPWEVVNKLLGIDTNNIDKLPKSKQININQKEMIYQMILDANYRENKNVYMIGGMITNFKPEDVKFNDKEVENYTRNMLLTSITEKVNFNPNVEIKLPKEFISYSVNPINGDFNYDSYSQTIYEDTEALVVYQLEENFIYNKIDIKFSGNNATYEIYNNKTKSFESVGANDIKKTINKENISTYLNNSGQVEIRVKTTEGSAIVPEISAEGVTK